MRPTEARHKGSFKNKPSLTITVRNQSRAIRDMHSGGPEEFIASESGEYGGGFGGGSSFGERWGFPVFAWTVDDWGALTFNHQAARLFHVLF